jgi:hypothetical protein
MANTTDATKATATRPSAIHTLRYLTLESRTWW